MILSFPYYLSLRMDKALDMKIVIKAIELTLTFGYFAAPPAGP